MEKLQSFGELATSTQDFAAENMLQRGSAARLEARGRLQVGLNLGAGGRGVQRLRDHRAASPPRHLGGPTHGPQGHQVQGAGGDAESGSR